MQGQNTRCFLCGKEKINCLVGGEWDVALSGGPALRRCRLPSHGRVDTRFVHCHTVYIRNLQKATKTRMNTGLPHTAQMSDIQLHSCAGDGSPVSFKR
jgi:hypothetical protein